MKKTVIIILIIVLNNIILFSQSTNLPKNAINTQEAKNNINKLVTICGTVVGMNENKNSDSLLFYIDKNSPEEIFTIIIYTKKLMFFNYKLEEKLITAHICVTGTITENNGKPSMVVNSENAIIFLKEISDYSLTTLNLTSTDKSIMNSATEKINAGNCQLGFNIISNAENISHSEIQKILCSAYECYVKKKLTEASQISLKTDLDEKIKLQNIIECYEVATNIDNIFKKYSNLLTYNSVTQNKVIFNYLETTKNKLKAINDK